MSAHPHGGHHTLWRWAVALWLVIVAVAGGLTLWWDESTEPRRYGWEEPGPTPSLPQEWQSPCAGATPDESGRAACFNRTRQPDPAMRVGASSRNRAGTLCTA
ncbi:hypothetical protein ABZ366_05725 [Streptomyces sp. NPDC005904]|uniref:hypothetical protein n=1 Tax=Streptomyces sp. NPDC005904 TaxID=3154570 RepID=UPI0033F26959